MATFQAPQALDLSGNVAENWKRFKQRFMLYLEALGSDKMPERRKIAILLTTIGDAALEVYNTFSFSESTPKLEEVIGEFDKYCQPLKNIIFERFKFHSLGQKEGQSVDSYVTELKKAASNCEFKDEEDMIRDRLVLGIRDKVMQERLLRDTSLTLKKAVEFCRTCETSQNQVRELQNTVESIKVTGRPMSSNNTSRLPSKVGSKQHNEFFLCKKCANTHRARNCPAYNKNCALCKDKHHFAKCCPNKDRLKFSNKANGKPKKKVYEVETDTATADQLVEDEYAIGVDFFSESDDLFVNSLENKSPDNAAITVASSSW
ncbi:uncharacterized protein LOC128985322 [Macrosteles quadrilineatus]|uniref:uncharacterized protein LOC128985322 n=1 Tax=Macrosteles quadrilineatus TaxID=74068 RepID=UPI0023E183D5|nr:uncharacterized protein LOC128985322 [Macrosteles quadrilineatus]